MKGLLSTTQIKHCMDGETMKFCDNEILHIIIVKTKNGAVL